ncbi:MAG: zinc-ribbon domain-containing protein [Firmicutes bacterium]|nr:zinc-ribbon domain-containing protein [Bacillota bacterium]
MGFIQKVAEGTKLLSSRARDFGEIAGDKARDLSRKSSELIELTKTKHELRKIEKEMENNLTGIGALYYQKVQGRENADEELGRLIESTKQLELEMKDLEEQMEAMQPAAPVCPECDAQLPENARFCSNCGKKTTEE